MNVDNIRINPGDEVALEHVQAFPESLAFAAKSAAIR
jgi:hypothetical protein